MQSSRSLSKAGLMAAALLLASLPASTQAMTAPASPTARRRATFQPHPGSVNAEHSAWNAAVDAKRKLKLGKHRSHMR